MRALRLRDLGEGGLRVEFREVQTRRGESDLVAPLNAFMRLRRSASGTSMGSILISR
jgi:hypothetical protein